MSNQYLFASVSSVNIKPIPVKGESVNIKFEVASVPQLPKLPAPLRLALTGTEEIAVSVVDERGNIKYSLLGIRPDGTFVSYSLQNGLKKKDGFKVNNSGQIVYFGDGAYLSLSMAQVF